MEEMALTSNVAVTIFLVLIISTVGRTNDYPIRKQFLTKLIFTSATHTMSALILKTEIGGTKLLEKQIENEGGLVSFFLKWLQKTTHS